MPAPSVRPSAVMELRRRLDAALSERDRHSAVNVAIESVSHGEVGVIDLYTKVLSPLLVDTGSAWQAGTLRVWEEHYASATVRTIVEAIYPEVARQAALAPRRGQSVLLANPPSELHDLGLRMLSDRFELAGYDVTFIGANTPLEEIMAAAMATHADLVILSVSTMYERVELREFLDTLHAKTPNCRILVGGAAFAHDSDVPATDTLDLEELGLADSSAEGPR